MRKPLVVIALSAILLVSAGSSFGMGRAPGPNMLTVNDVEADPAAYEGELTLTGTVARVGEDGPESFFLIDTREAKLCKSITCAKFYLPVTTKGALPSEWDEVVATGTFVDGGKSFRASGVKVVGHLQH